MWSRLIIPTQSSQSLPKLAALFQVPVVVMLVTEDSVVSVDRVGDVEPQETDLEAARSSLATGTVLRGGVYPNLASRFDFWPVETAEDQNAVIGLALDPDERPSAQRQGVITRQLAAGAAILAAPAAIAGIYGMNFENMRS